MNTEYRGQDCPHEELATGWALHVLEPAEVAEFEAHLPGCPRCQDVVAATQEVSAELGRGVPQEDPPVHLRANLLARIDQEPQVSARPDGHSGGIAEASSTVGERQPDDELSIRRSARKSARPGNRRTLLAIAASVLAVVAIGGLGIRVVQLGAERDAEAGRSAALAKAVQLIGDPNMRRALIGAAGDGHPVAMVVAAGNRGVLVPMDLPANDQTKQTYVLWGVAGAGRAPQALGAFDVAGPESEPRTVSWPDNAPQFTGYAVSLENGRAAPTTPTTVVGQGNLE
ncbi:MULTISPECIES: anti-sigma factor [unclassified Crossiella]|uniref:anti-sigma factor domain-containing protein n=1 Tax=unclassified Crossiella TaxID=2620835 RepID=UPI001FFF6BE6|nr:MULTISPECIES: anti-sigma factor [unclassified Crossiella]MCK2243664.1 anti-sigma factor [Crossiella sp. S99.2]MCK2257523.1 anti-sigma factor [Crossiella sp. S99.1]